MPRRRWCGVPIRSEGVLAIEASPFARPAIGFLVVRDALPIAPGELRRILDAKTALVRRADHVHSAKRFFREAAKPLALVPIDQNNANAAVNEFVGSDNARQAATGDDDLRVPVVQALP